MTPLSRVLKYLLDQYIACKLVSSYDMAQYYWDGFMTLSDAVLESHERRQA